MHYINNIFGSFHGYLLLDDNDEGAVNAAELKNVLLDVGSGKFFELLVGYYDGAHYRPQSPGITVTQ